MNERKDSVQALKPDEAEVDCTRWINCKKSSLKFCHLANVKEEI